MSGNLTIPRKLIDEAGRVYGYPSEIDNTSRSIFTYKEIRHTNIQEEE